MLCSFSSNFCYRLGEQCRAHNWPRRGTDRTLKTDSFEFKVQALSFHSRRDRPFKYAIGTDSTADSPLHRSLCKTPGVMIPIYSLLSTPQKPDRSASSRSGLFVRNPTHRCHKCRQRPGRKGKSLSQETTVRAPKHGQCSTKSSTNHHWVISTSASPNMLAFLTSNPSAGSASASTSSPRV